MEKQEEGNLVSQLGYVLLQSTSLIQNLSPVECWIKGNTDSVGMRTNELRLSKFCGLNTQPSENSEEFGMETSEAVNVPALR